VNVAPNVIRESFIFTHKFNFDVKGNATGAIMILTVQTST
jgi:hypothetical protein